MGALDDFCAARNILGTTTSLLILMLCPSQTNKRHSKHPTTGNTLRVSLLRGLTSDHLHDQNYNQSFELLMMMKPVGALMQLLLRLLLPFQYTICYDVLLASGYDVWKAYKEDV